MKINLLCVFCCPESLFFSPGFILALLGLIFSWVPGLGWVLWALGLIFSFVGIFRTPRGLAIAGLVISCIALIVLIILVSAIASLV